jgi:hypothetical protein
MASSASTRIEPAYLILLSTDATASVKPPPAVLGKALGDGAKRPRPSQAGLLRIGMRSHPEPDGGVLTMIYGSMLVHWVMSMPTSKGERCRKVLREHDSDGTLFCAPVTE